MIRRLALVCGLLAMTLEPALADMPAAAGKNRYVYDFTRYDPITGHGSKIGTDTVEVERAGDTTVVKFTTSITVTVAYVTVHKFEHTATETWKGNQLASFKSQTDNNGTKHTVSVTSAGDTTRLDVDGKANNVPHKLVPGSFWSKALIPSGDVFAEDDGKLSTVKVSDVGEETLAVNGVKHQTHHFRTTGGIERDLWFEGDVLLRLQLKGPDLSRVVSDLRT